LDIPADDVDLARDRALVERFQAGDRAAFDELYQRYRHRLLRYCLKRVGDRETADEIAQEAFTRALKAMPTFAGERRFYPWVTVIASRLCIDHYRQTARLQATGTLDAQFVDGDHEAVDAAIDSELVTKAMGRLLHRHRDVLRLREIDGLSYQQIADQYGINSRTVDALLFRARKALRREFAAVGGCLATVPFLRRLPHVFVRIRDRTATLVTLSPGTAAAAATAAVATAALTFAPTAGVRTPPANPPAGRPVTATTVIPSTSGAFSPGSADPAASSTPQHTTAGDSPPSPASTVLPASGPGPLVPGLLGAGGTVTLPGLQALIPSALNPVLPPAPTVPVPAAGPISQTLTTVQQQLGGH